MERFHQTGRSVHTAFINYWGLDAAAVCVHGHWGALRPVFSHSGQFDSMSSSQARFFCATACQHWRFSLSSLFMRAAEHVVRSLKSVVVSRFDSLCVAGFSPAPLRSGRWPPAPSWPPQWSYPSSELRSGPGSWPAGSTATSNTHSDTVQWWTEDVSMCWTPICWHINRCLSDSEDICNIFSPCFCLCIPI